MAQEGSMLFKGCHLDRGRLTGQHTGQTLYWDTHDLEYFVSLNENSYHDIKECVGVDEQCSSHSSFYP